MGSLIGTSLLEDLARDPQKALKWGPEERFFASHRELEGDKPPCQVRHLEEQLPGPLPSPNDPRDPRARSADGRWGGFWRGRWVSECQMNTKTIKHAKARHASKTETNTQTNEQTQPIHPTNNSFGKKRRSTRANNPRTSRRIEPKKQPTHIPSKTRETRTQTQRTPKQCTLNPQINPKHTHTQHGCVLGLFSAAFMFGLRWVSVGFGLGLLSFLQTNQAFFVRRDLLPPMASQCIGSTVSAMPKIPMLAQNQRHMGVS